MPYSSETNKQQDKETTRKKMAKGNKLSLGSCCNFKKSA